MKYTSKWLVIPYSSIANFESKNQRNKIFGNKSMSKDEKIAAYNYHVMKNFRKDDVKLDRYNNDELKLNNEYEDKFHDDDDPMT